MIYRQSTAWITLPFDIEGKVRERALAFGRFDEVSQHIARVACGERGYEMGGAVIAAPFMFPDGVLRAVNDALAIKLSHKMAQNLRPELAAAWCQKPRINGHE